MNEFPLSHYSVPILVGKMSYCYKPSIQKQVQEQVKYLQTLKNILFFNLPPPSNFISRFLSLGLF